MTKRTLMEVAKTGSRLADAFLADNVLDVLAIADDRIAGVEVVMPLPVTVAAAPCPPLLPPDPDPAFGPPPCEPPDAESPL